MSSTFCNAVAKHPVRIVQTEMKFHFKFPQSLGRGVIGHHPSYLAGATSSPLFIMVTAYLKILKGTLVTFMRAHLIQKYSFITTDDCKSPWIRHYKPLEIEHVPHRSNEIFKTLSIIHSSISNYFYLYFIFDTNIDNNNLHNRDTNFVLLLMSEIYVIILLSS